MQIDGPRRATTAVILAHGAGAPMDSDFMQYFAEHLSGRGVRVVRFEFPYMAERRRTGKKKPPDREPKLLDCWRQILTEVSAKTRIIGGKSMGGRMASLLADEQQAEGLLLLGYPFHPTGRPEKLRTEHLESLQTPTLILQGERDPFGKREEVEGYRLADSIQLHWLPDGDHSFKPRKASGRTLEQNLEDAAQAARRFIDRLRV